MSNEHYPNYYNSYPASATPDHAHQPDNESSLLDSAIALSGIHAAHYVFQRIETIVGDDGQEYTQLVHYSLA